MKARRFYPQTRWVKADSGNTYICPINVKEGASEEELKRLCVNESENPNNA